MSKKEGRYYVEYLGWKESAGLFGREFTEPIIRELLARRRLNNELPKMTIKLTETEIQISQEVVNQADGKPGKTHYPAIPTKDAAFVIQGLYPDNDVAACIFLGYNPYTKCAVHVHVYRFDREATAAMFVAQLNEIIQRPDFNERIVGIEKDLAELGHVTLRRQFETGTDSGHRHSGSDGLSYGTSSPYSLESLSPKYPTAEEEFKKRSDIKITKSKKNKTPKPDPEMKKVFRSLHEELEYKIKSDDGPILLPPKDYDTIVRRHGKLEIRDEVKARSRSVIGPDGIFGHLTKETEVDVSNGIRDSHTANGIHTDRPASAQRSEIASSSGSKPKGVFRSQSDNGLHAQLRAGTPTQGPPSLQRHSSFASSEMSNNSDEYFADGLYQGYKPKQHRRSKSKDSYNSSVEDVPQLAMWSPTFSFGQSGARSLHTHHEEDPDGLNRTAPAGMIIRKTSHQPDLLRHDEFVRESSDVRRSHSHKKDRTAYRISS